MATDIIAQGLAASVKNNLATITGSSTVGTNDGASGSLFTTVQGFVSYLLSSAGSTFVKTIAPWTGAVARTVSAALYDTVNVAHFGIKGDGETDNADAMATMQTWLATRSFAGNSTRVKWPAGRYNYTASPNWAIIGLQMDFQGECWMINNGVGSSFIIDGGASGAGVYNIMITGRPLIYGAAGTAHGVYVRSLFNSQLSFDVRGAGTTYSGFYGEWLVENDIDYICSSNEGGLYSAPLNGIQLTSRASDGLQSSYNRITACVSGMTTGIYLDAALGNKFFAGSVQNTSKGLLTTPNANLNSFTDTDFESNTLDVEDASRLLTLRDCDVFGKVKFDSGAIGGKVVGGRVNSVQVAAGAVGTYIETTFNDSGTGTIVDAGTRTRFGPIFDATNQVWYNGPVSVTVPTVGASPYTYQNTSGTNQMVSVYDATGTSVTSLVFARLAGYFIATKAGPLILAPQDNLIITYSGAAPQVVVWPMV